jgi:hypothetical protein
MYAFVLYIAPLFVGAAFFATLRGSVIFFHATAAAIIRHGRPGQQYRRQSQ